ncbi:MAG: sulfatase [Synoicihabitans sp.]
MWLSLTCLAAADRPNIFVFLTDDLSARDVGAYGSTEVRTPTIDQLAKDGLTFDRSFIVSPACAPSRAAMLTGLTPAHNGAEANHTYMTDDVAPLIKRFKALGYKTAAFGKVAHGKDSERHHFDHVDRSRLPFKATEAWLRDIDPDQPVALFFGTNSPHVPWPAVDGYDPDDVIIPAFHIDTPDTRLFRARYYTDVTLADTHFARVKQLVDRYLGVENRITVFSSDHGAQWPFGKWNLYDEGTRVPLVISWPEHIKPATRTEAMVSWIDLLPTLLDVAGDDLPTGLDGRSFRHLFNRPESAHRDRIFTTHDNDGRANVYPIRSVRDSRWKYIRNLQPSWIQSDHSYRYRKDDAGAYFWSWETAAAENHTDALILNRYLQRPGEELYDLVNDPDETNNLAADSRHADTLLRLRHELDTWMRDQGDDGQVVPEPWLPGQSGLLEPRSPWPPYHP